MMSDIFLIAVSRLQFFDTTPLTCQVPRDMIFNNAIDEKDPKMFQKLRVDEKMMMNKNNNKEGQR